MIVSLISTDSVNTGYVVVSGSGSQTWLMPGVTISNDITPIIQMIGSDNGFVSDGTILALWTGAGLTLEGTLENVVLGSSSIFRSGAAVGSPSILSSGSFNSVTNHGLIATLAGVAIGMLGGGNSIYNDSTIEGGSGGVFLGLNGGVGDSVINYGTINAGNAQLPVFDARFNHAVQVEGDSSVVINHGSLAAVAAFGAGVHFGAPGFGGGGSRVENYGDITSAHFWGVDMFDLTNGGAVLFNQGLISGGIGAVRGSLSDDAVTNAGTVLGLVDLNSGNDRYDGRGGVVFGLITGGLGNDTMIGGAQDDNLFGDVGNDLMRGGAGDDTISASGGNDTIFGGIGDDTITGGTGRDLITGGAGADLFVFTTFADIGNTATTRDQIIDFTSKFDRIDLGALPGTLNFIGAAAFSNVANQLRYTAATGILEGDTNGNGAADFSLFLGAGTDLAAGDLVL